MKQFRPLKRGDASISADDINALAQEAKRLGKIEVSEGEVDNSGSGIVIRLPLLRVAFWARLTAEYAGAPGAYTWIEQERSALDTFTDLQYGRYDDGLSQAVEANRTTGLPTDATAGEGRGSYVWLEQGMGEPVTGGVVQEWIFRHGGGGADNVRPVFVTGPAESGRYPARIDFRDENTPDRSAAQEAPAKRTTRGTGPSGRPPATGRSSGTWLTSEGRLADPRLGDAQESPGRQRHVKPVLVHHGQGHVGHLIA